MRRPLIAASYALFFIVSLMHDALAQATYPTKSVRFVVPVTTGGPSDIVARLLSEKLAASLGKPVIVDNRPGASNTLGAALVAKAEPDGHTLLLGAANMATVQILMTDLPFDPIKDFTAVSLTHLTPYVVLVSGQSQPKTLGELLTFVRANSGKVTYGTAGPGSPHVLATLLLAQLSGGLGNMTEVPYKGSSAAHPDLISNRVTFMIDPLASGVAHIRAGSLRALAVTTPQRNAAFPDVPTVSEAGVPGYDFASWGGVFVPAGTPHAIVTKLNAAIVEALASPDIRKRFDDMGLEAKSSTPDAFGKFLQAETTRWGALLKKP